jgi:hypothetical protein
MTNQTNPPTRRGLLAAGGASLIAAPALIGT